MMMVKIGIFGGTFDPPHRGHIYSAQQALRQLGLDSLLVIPTGIPPHKGLPEGTPAAADRLAMTRLAAEELAGAEVLDLEIRREGRSYTIDTLRTLEEAYPDSRFFLLMGTDMLLTFEQWKDFREILRRAELAAFCRGVGEREQLTSFADYLRKTYGAKVHIIESEAISISSSELREQLPQRMGREFLSDAVYSRIIRDRFYGAKPDFSWLREKSYAMLKPKRIPHVAGCEQEAVRLAERWGADVELAREAAILHDITKKYELSDQLILCEKYDIIIDNVEKREVKLLHAKTGAAIAREEFGMPKEVCDAILWHTTGRENMTLLEKIIYMADYIEPNRSFEGVQPLRELAYRDLDSAMLLGFEMSIADMEERGIVPHERTQQAMSWLKYTQNK